MTSRFSKSYTYSIYTAMVMILCFCVFVVICGGFSSYDEKWGITTNNEEYISDSIEKNLKNVKSVNEFENLINGTTWHFTEILDYTDIPCWFKVTFENGSYKTYYANPSEGHWTYGGSGEYKIVESRYSNTGGKYIVVSWDGKMSIMKGEIGDIPCSLALTQNREFFVQPFVGKTMRGKMEYGDYEWK